MKKLLKLLPLAFVAILVTSCGNSDSKMEVEALLVGIEEAHLSSDYNQKPYVGTVEEQESTTAAFVGTGTIQSVNVEEGQHVSKGQVIAVMDPTQCKNTLAATKASLDQALDAHKRMKQLYDANSLPEIKWIEIESQVQQAKSSYDMAKKALEDCVLRAPASGVIGTKYMRTGEIALTSQPVVTILNINKVKVKVSVPESEISSIGASTPTTISVAALGETFQGGRIEKGVSADALTHTYDIRISVNNPQGKLLPGMVANVKLSESDAAQSSAITLPVRSVQQDSKGRKFVWVVDNGVSHRKNVTLGETSGNRIVITSGVNEGDKVITSGYQKVSEGSKVKI